MWNLRTAALVFALFCLAVAAAHGRTWTDSSGRIIEADFVRVDGTDVVLLKDGREVRVPLTRLTAADQQFARDQAKDADDAGAVAKVPAVDITKPRTWTDRNGQTLQAAFASMSGGKVDLRTGLKQLFLPFADFSDQDQELIRLHMESRGLGLRVPPTTGDLSESTSIFKTNSGERLDGILRRIETSGEIVIQLRNQRKAFVLGDFSPDAQDKLRKRAAELDLSDRLPTDDAIRVWTDWRGEHFTGKLDLLNSLNSMSLIQKSVTFQVDGQRISKYFNSLSEQDRELVRSMLIEAGGGKYLPEPFTEPTTEVRTWQQLSPPSTIEGKFIEMVSSRQVLLRTETDPQWKVNLSTLSFADRDYVRSMLTADELASFPIFDDECRTWEYGPFGSGYSALARLGEVADGFIVLRRPTSSVSPSSPESLTVPIVCLSPADQEHLREELARQGDEQAMTEGALAEIRGDEMRDWDLKFASDLTNLKNKRLLFVEPRIVEIGESRTGMSNSLNFHHLSAADQKYVGTAVAKIGLAAYTRPPKPSAQPAQGKQTSSSDSSAFSTDGMSSYQKGYLVGRIVFFVLIAAAIILVVAKVATR